MPAHWSNSTSEAVGARRAPWLLALVFSHPLLLWPMIEGVPLDPTRDFMSGAVDQPSGPLNMLFFPPLAAVAVWLHLRHCTDSRVGPLSLGITLIAAYLVWAGMSTLWSVEPSITLRRVVLQALIVVAVALPSLTARNARAGVTALFWVLVIAAGLNAVAVATMPPTSLGHAGIYPHKNELGVVAALMVLLGLWGLFAGAFKERLLGLPLAVLGITFLIVSKSKTSLGLALLVPFMALAVLAATRLLRWSPSVTVPAIFSAVTLVYLVGVWSWVWDFHAVALALFGDPTLTMRTDIWSFAYEMASQRPLTGYGYEVFWGAGPGSPNQIHGEGFVRKVVHAHNGYLDVTVHLGLIGLALVLTMVLYALQQAGRRATREPGATFAHLSIVIFLMLYNLLEVTWFRSFSITSMVLVMILARPQLASGRMPATARRPRRTFKRYRWQPASTA